MHKIRVFCLRWWPTVLCLGIILYLTLSDDPLDGAQKAVWFEGADKVVHALMFGGLTSVMMLDYRRESRVGQLRPRDICVIAFIVAAFGILDEVMQETLTTSRTGDVLDFCADAVGILLATFIAPSLIKCLVARRYDE